MEAVMAGKHTVLMCMAAVALLICLGGGGCGEAATAAQEIRRGLSADHDTSYSQFQQVLSDPTGAFALGFLRVNSTMLDLAVLQLPSAFPFWRAIPDRPAPWSAAASLSFNGSLVLTDRATNIVLWSTAAAAGDRAVLNTSNLQIQSSTSPSVAWREAWRRGGAVCLVKRIPRPGESMASSCYP